MSPGMRKPTICISENKDADQLAGTAWFVSGPGQNPNCWFSRARAQILGETAVFNKETINYMFYLPVVHLNHLLKNMETSETI